MPGVSVTGGAGETITLPFPPGQNALLAQSLADGITQAVRSGALKAVDYTGGRLPAASSGVDEEVVIKANGPLVLPRQATAVINAAQSSIVFGGGASNETVLSGSGNLTFFTDGGAGSIVTGDGNNRIIQTGSGPWDIHTGAGNNEILISGGANTVSAGSGHNTILLADGNNLVASTGRDVIQAVSGADTIAATGNNLVQVEGVRANLTFIGGDGPATVTGGAGSETVYGTAGGYFRGGTAGHNLIVGGDGPTTIVGGGSGDTLYATGSALTQMYAGSGNETLDGSLASGNNVLRAGSGSDQLVGGFGNDILAAGTGTSTLQGGTGGDVFEFFHGDAAKSAITDFSNIEGDKVKLVGYGPSEVQYALQHAQITPGGTVVTLTDDTKITFANVSDLGKSSFS